jgi:uncharacterized integral membrane protein
MRIKTMIIILVTVLLTVVVVNNSDKVPFWFFWIPDLHTSKLTMMLSVGVVTFILGVLVGRPNRVKKLGSDYPDTENEKPNTNTLSDEDRDYIH